MKRRIFARTSLLAAAAAASGCAGAPEAEAATWPGTDFDEVRAFVYACEADRDKTFVRADGSLHPGVLNAPGVRLTNEQAARLLAAGRRRVRVPGRTACYVPHHAFVFYRAGRPVAVMEICFTCHRHASVPRGLPQEMDYDALWALLHELGVMADTTPGCYEAAWRARAGRQETSG